MSSYAGAVIRSARQRAGLSQAELARRAGISQPVVSAYEMGRREPGLSMLAKLIEASGHELHVSFEPRRDQRRPLPDTPLGHRLRRERRAIVDVAGRRGASNVRVFGSAARGDDDDASDVDLLVDLAEGTSLIDLIGLERELSELLSRPVDVVPAAGLKPSVAARAIEEAIPL